MNDKYVGREVVPAERIPIVMQELGEMERAVARTHERAQVLYGKLERVLRKEASAGVDCEKEPQGTVPLAESIATIRRASQETCSLLSSIIERLEV